MGQRREEHVRARNALHRHLDHTEMVPHTKLNRALDAAASVMVRRRMTEADVTGWAAASRLPGGKLRVADIRRFAAEFEMQS